MTTAPASDRAGPGRPVDLAKRAAILEAGRELFFRLGPQVSLDAIARRAGVARQTVYNGWPNKGALFAEIVHSRADAVSRPLLDVADDAPIGATLARFGRSYLELVLDPESIGLLRALLGDPTVRQQFAAVFYATGPSLGANRLADYLRRRCAAGDLIITDIDLAVEMFVASLRGNHHLAALLADQPMPAAAELDRRVQAAVALFLKAYAPTGQDSCR